MPLAKSASYVRRKRAMKVAQHGTQLISSQKRGESLHSRGEFGSYPEYRHAETCWKASNVLLGEWIETRLFSSPLVAYDGSNYCKCNVYFFAFVFPHYKKSSVWYTFLYVILLRLSIGNF